jgi:hypothetical protein
MGIGRAERILINNSSDKNPDEVRAKGIIVNKNGGFGDVNI